jgi:hypothetical protein
MKLLYPLCIILFCTFSVSAQNDGINPEGEVDTVVIIPTHSDANLSMLIAPEGFEISEAFNGYIHYQLGAAIIMTFIENVNFVKLTDGMNEEFYNKNGLTFISQTSITTDNGTEGQLYKFSFVIDEKDFIRYMVYIGDINNTLWMSITYPQKAEVLAEDAILKSLQTVTLNTVKG